MSDYKRPILVTFIGIIFGLVAILWLASGAATIILGDTVIDDIIAEYPDLEGIEGLSAVLGSAMIIAGIVFVLLCAGFMKGWSIMWYLGVIFSVLGAIFNLISIFVSPISGVISLAVNLIVLFYLFKDNVKQYFLNKA